MKRYTAILGAIVVLSILAFSMASLADGDRPATAADYTLISVDSGLPPQAVAELPAGRSKLQADGSDAVYFFSQDRDDTTMMLKLVNTGSSSVQITGQAFYADGATQSSLEFTLAANEMITICSDDFTSVSGFVWDVYKTSYARLILPPQVVIEGWIAYWDGSDYYSDEIGVLTRPLRFTRIPLN